MARYEVYRILGDLPVYRLEAWNDHPGRTHAEVLALLDKAIAATS